MNPTRTDGCALIPKASKEATDYVQRVRDDLTERLAHEPEFLQAVGEILPTLAPVFDEHPEWVGAGVLERLVEPERTIAFRVAWMDDDNHVQVNRGWRVGFSSAIGPYKGGLRFHPSVNLSILKFLGFEQIFKNSLTGQMIGGGKGGSDFDPKGKSDGEVMRFCQAFMSELFRHIGPDTDVPAGDIGVGSREIGYLFGQYRRLTNTFNGVLTGKRPGWGGSLIRTEATGYGVVYYAMEMLAARDESIRGRKCLVSGAGNVAQYTVEKLINQQAIPLTVSDSDGFIYVEDGIDEALLEEIKDLKNNRRGRLSELAEKHKNVQFTKVPHDHDANPLWSVEAACAFPCATQNEINEKDAKHLVKNGVTLVCEGANMPTTAEGQEVFLNKDVLYGPAKAANAGGVAVSALEMAQNSQRESWSRDDVEIRLREIMQTIFGNCRQAAEMHGVPGNYLAGANIAGFTKVARSIVDQGVI